MKAIEQMTIDELREALRDNVQAQDACYRANKPRQAESLALRTDERSIRRELAKRGECCGWSVDGGLRCRCVDVVGDVNERLLALGYSRRDAAVLSEYCQSHPAIQLARWAAQQRELWLDGEDRSPIEGIIAACIEERRQQKEGDKCES